MVYFMSSPLTSVCAHAYRLASAGAQLSAALRRHRCQLHLDEGLQGRGQLLTVADAGLVAPAVGHEVAEDALGDHLVVADAIGLGEPLDDGPPGGDGAWV